MKYLCPEVPWEKIKSVGFDMDGTLYDEFEFICQVFNPIAKLFSDTENSSEKIMNAMLLKWLEKGSSYPFIFSEIAIEIDLDKKLHEKKIKEALLIFRNFNPTLLLSERTKFLLDDLKSDYNLFLVTDGSSKLQWNKINSLGLKNYFKDQNIFISGDFAKGSEKPNLMSLNNIEIFQSEYKSNEVVFIGDRKCDEDYANNAGFYFININSVFKKK